MVSKYEPVEFPKPNSSPYEKIDQRVQVIGGEIEENGKIVKPAKDLSRDYEIDRRIIRALCAVAQGHRESAINYLRETVDTNPVILNGEYDVTKRGIFPQHATFESRSDPLRTERFGMRYQLEQDSLGSVMERFYFETLDKVRNKATLAPEVPDKLVEPPKIEGGKKAKKKK